MDWLIAAIFESAAAFWAADETAIARRIALFGCALLIGVVAWWFVQR